MLARNPQHVPTLMALARLEWLHGQPEAAIAALEPKFSAPGARFTIQRIVVDGEFAVIHLHGQPDPAALGGAVADIYRLKQGKIVEHWDVLQPVPAKAANPHPMF